MKGLIYTLVKYVVKAGLYSYHKRIKVVGLEHIPKNKPVLFLPNHQSALIDVFLIATGCGRTPYFLTRADVFSRPFLNRVFAIFRMLPIYRMRDGRKTVSNNTLVFETCAKLLANGEALVIFPEANHNLKRRVRPLNKGFTRIILRTMELYPQLDIQLVPVGFNYSNAVHFPDEVAIYYGAPIAVKSLYDANDLSESSRVLKSTITARLRELTTHIPEELEYAKAAQKLARDKVDFLYPKETNDRLKSYLHTAVTETEPIPRPHEKRSFTTLFFEVLNFPIVLLWRFVIKPKVPEEEFLGTFRFATGLVLFPCYILILFLLFTLFVSLKTAVVAMGIFLLLNVVLIKMGMR